MNCYVRFFNIINLSALIGGPCVRGGQTLIHRDDFGNEPLSPRCVQTYRDVAATTGLQVAGGSLVCPFSVCWHLDTPPLTMPRYPHGVRLAADLFFYPRPAVPWVQSGNPFPLGFQDDPKGGVGKTHARLALVDADGDRYTDGIALETSDGATRQSTILPGVNPARELAFHRFTIDWQPRRVIAYVDGHVAATHDVSLPGPMWIVSRNEHVNMLVDDLECLALDADAAPPPAASAPRAAAAALRRQPSNALPRYWLLAGLGAEAYGLEQIIPDPSLTVADAWSQGVRPPLPPLRPAELGRFDAAILANIDLHSIGPAGRRMLQQFLAGGALLVLGGKAAYGYAGWRPELEPWLPVELLDTPLDLHAANEARLRHGEAHPITAGLDCAAAPPVQYLHRVQRVRSGAMVLLYAGDEPFLAIWEKDGARVACVLGTPYGPVNESYFGWPGWSRLIQNLLTWLARREGGTP